MPWYANDEDKLMDWVVGRWYEIANEEIDDIGGWRDNPIEKSFPASPFNNGEPNGFFGYTTSIVSWIARKYPSLNPAPIQTIYSAVNAWYTDHDADRIPPQNELEGFFWQAMILVNTIRNDIISRTVNTKPGENQLQIAEQQRSTKGEGETPLTTGSKTIGNKSETISIKLPDDENLSLLYKELVNQQGKGLADTKIADNFDKANGRSWLAKLKTQRDRGKISPWKH